MPLLKDSFSVGSIDHYEIIKSTTPLGAETTPR
jgi:hypothetical protein